MKKIIISSGLIMLCITLNAQTKIKVKNDKTKSNITYSMNHPLHQWTGKSEDVSSILLTDDTKRYFYSVAVSVKVSSFNSQNANRDSHMMEATEALIYPTVTFSSTVLNRKESILLGQGNLTFHGVTKLVVFASELKTVGKNIEITGNFVVKMTDFKIEPPSLMGLSTDDEIKIFFVIVY